MYPNSCSRFEKKQDAGLRQAKEREDGEGIELADCYIWAVLFVLFIRPLMQNPHLSLRFLVITGHTDDRVNRCDVK